MTYLVISLTLGSLVGYFILRKRKKTQKNSSIAFQIFTMIWPNILCLLLTFLFPELINQSTAYITYPRYEAEIIEVKGKYEFISKGDESGRRVIMYTPTVRFKMEDRLGYIDKPLNMSSGEKPVIGDYIQIAYRDNSIHGISIKGYLFLAGNTLLVILIFYPLLYSVFYITGRNTKVLKTVGVRGAVLIAVLALVTFSIILFKALIN